jgi:hypothetical protein
VALDVVVGDWVVTWGPVVVARALGPATLVVLPVAALSTIAANDVVVLATPFGALVVVDR